MKIPQSEFRAWAEEVLDRRGQKFSWKSVARVIGYSQARLSMQKTRGYIESSVGVSLCRVINLDPVTELLQFPYFPLLADPADPSPGQVLALISTYDLTSEAQYRIGAAERGREPMRDEVEYLDFLRWYDTVVERGAGINIAKKMGITPTVLSSRSIRNTWDMGELHAMCEAGGLNYRVALVAAGYLSLKEVGLPDDLRERTLEKLDDAAFFAFYRQSISHMERQAKSVSDMRRLSEHLG